MPTILKSLRLFNTLSELEGYFYIPRTYQLPWNLFQFNLSKLIFSVITYLRSLIKYLYFLVTARQGSYIN